MTTATGAYRFTTAAAAGGSTSSPSPAAQRRTSSLRSDGPVTPTQPVTSALTSPVNE
jgi:hypothetical protein